VLLQLLTRKDALVVINKFDLNEKISGKIEEYCNERNIFIAGRIPFDPLVNEALRRGELLVRYKADSRPANAISDIWKQIGKLIYS